MTTDLEWAMGVPLERVTSAGAACLMVRFLRKEVAQLRAQVASLTADHAGQCDEQAPCQRCADRAELEKLRQQRNEALRLCRNRYQLGERGSHLVDAQQITFALGEA